MPGYRCESCGYEIKTDEREEPRGCPICRGRLLESNVSGDWDEAVCKSCERKFKYPKGTTPYKCPWCDYTFETTLGGYF
ncbi:hypothetical protein DRN46_01495 [Thermococci archaeon]|nr:MAG: hypothetical protein DRN46_01495 [Thermococci archaeon]RLF92351.1 MAG: hypothetical protein DRN52_08160 [Thermococci archaeon]